MDSSKEPETQTENDLKILKIRNEIALQELDKKLKEKEYKRRVLLSPSSVTILVALIGLIGASISVFLQRNNQLIIEEKKFQYSIYQKALESKDNVTAAQVLDFYIKAGLLPGEENKYTKLLENGDSSAIPTYGGIYKDIKVPDVDSTMKLSIKNGFIIGNGTRYVLSYKANNRLDLNKLNTIVFHCSFTSAKTNADILAKFMSDTLTGSSSAHILIDRDGKIIQQVPFNFVAFHARSFNQFSIGIELINQGSIVQRNGEYYNYLNQKVGATSVDCGNAGQCWEKYTDKQIETALIVCQLICKEYNITKIVNHFEIEKSKTDPGPFFPIDKMRSIVSIN